MASRVRRSQLRPTFPTLRSMEGRAFDHMNHAGPDPLVNTEPVVSTGHACARCEKSLHREFALTTGGVVVIGSGCIRDGESSAPLIPARR